MNKRIERREMEIDRDILVGYTKTFINRYNCYPQQQADGHYFKAPRQLTFELVEEHLKGTITLGAYALNDQNYAKWICLDADDAIEWYGLMGIARQFAEQQMTTYLEPSRRGGHLWLFVDPLPGKDARRFAKYLLAQHKLEGLEVYPKQDVLRTGVGSLVRLPLGIHRKAVPPRRFTFKTLDGDDLAPTIREQMAILAHPQKVSADYVRSVLAAIPESKQVFPTPTFKPGQVIDLDQPVSERIKGAMSVRDFVGQYVDLDRSNRGLCPFHDDHRQSFSVSEDGNYWHCFAGCGGGSIIDFYMKLEAKDFKQAVSDLARLLLPPLF
ncbi:MAG: hypothetical protein K8L97_06020 [Anaerolineae bacterium]|nr:hypothetical protein [Anaerolineae bacterium]